MPLQTYKPAGFWCFPTLKSSTPKPFPSLVITDGMPSKAAIFGGICWGALVNPSGTPFEHCVQATTIILRLVMKTNLTLILAFAVLSAVQTSFSQFLQARFVSSAYAWQRHDTVGSSSNHLYGYQTIQLSLSKNDFTFSTYVQGWNDFAGPLKNDPKLRLYSLSLKWRNIGDVADATIGRQAVFAGVGNGTVDGLSASARFLDKRIKVLGYIGALAPPGMKGEIIDNPSDNAMYGAQVVAMPVDFGQISVSYTNKRIQPEAYTALRRDSLFNPVLVEISPSARIEEYISADASGEYEIVYGYLRYDHDLQFERMSRFQFFTRIAPIERIGITVEYLKREPRISYNSIFSAFTYNSLKEFEVGLEYEVHFLEDVRTFARYGEVSYGEEISQQYTFGANWKYISASASSISGYNGRINAASINGGYPLFDKMLTPTASFTYGYYKLNRYQAKRHPAVSAALGVVYRPMPVLSVDTQVQWIQNKIYKNDIRLFVRASYLLSERLTLF
jgi:pimeloyl-ACP methyl ester carboxylesterase